MDHSSLYDCLQDSIKTRRLLSDAKQTATALLTIKYDILEPREPVQLSHGLQCLCHLLSIHHSTWSVIEQPLIDRVVAVAGTRDENESITLPALSILGLMALETRTPRHIPESSMPSILQSFLSHPTAMPEILVRISTGSMQEVDTTLQFVACIIQGLVLVDGNQTIMYSVLRQSGLWSQLALLIQNKPIASAVRPRLADLQVLLKAALWLNSRLKGNMNSQNHQRIFNFANAKLTDYIGSLRDNETLWEMAGIADQFPMDVFNEEASWGAFLDFIDFILYDNDSYQNEYLRHLGHSSPEERFPLARASIAISKIMIDVFGLTITPPASEREADILNGFSDLYVPPDYIPGTKTEFPFALTSQALHDHNEAESSSAAVKGSIEDFMKSINSIRPLLFDWSTLHFVGVSKFMKLWTDCKAEMCDFENIEALMRMLFIRSSISGLESTSFSAVDGVIAKLDMTTYEDLRAYQLQSVGDEFKDVWNEELDALHKKFVAEAVDLVQEQRSRLLLAGDWFFAEDPRKVGIPKKTSNPHLHSDISKNGTWYFICMSPTRRSLQYNFFLNKTDTQPSSEQLTRSVDISQISKVTVDLITPEPITPMGLKRVSLRPRIIYNRIQIVNANGSSGLTFFTETPEKAAAWSDGLLMLKNHSYQSVETKKYIELFANTKLRLQLLNFGRNDVNYAKTVEPADTSDFDNGVVGNDFFYDAM